MGSKKSAELDLSVIIITKNEEDRLEALLQSLPSGVEIIVVDSQSEDRTLEIARACGAKIKVHPFEDYSQQKNLALSLATRSWVLSVDADERLSPALRQWLESLESCEEIGYRLQRRLVFLGRTMRWGRSVDHPLRLFRRGTGEFHGAIHEKLSLDTKVDYAPKSAFLFHHSYRNLSDYWSRFNRYTSMMAQSALAEKKLPPLYLLILRPFFEFLSRYIFRLGFLDGYPGFVYALNSSIYAFTKYAKLRELKEQGS